MFARFCMPLEDPLHDVCRCLVACCQQPLEDHGQRHSFHAELAAIFAVHLIELRLGRHKTNE